ncbi:hypothetical protein [Porcipelethomonas sp.]|uniref:hypothetical protein n=1 Tax=Porcipelethomonas sp. TaxID=2981675 RepID=UPI003EF7609B
MGNNKYNADEFVKMISHLSDISRVKNDKELHKTDEESMANHSHEYDRLLTAYTSFVEKTLKAKRKMKKTFFTFSMIVMIASSLFVAVSVILTFVGYFWLDINFKDCLLACATSATSFLTVFIVIPKIIAKYLFNSGEETIMKDIVSGIQEYDKTIREKLKK